MGTFMYFAYGSNLWTKRIHENNPSAIFKTIAVLKDYKLEFGHMSQRWKGASANIYPTPGSHVCGILWEISRDDLPNLDQQEGVNDKIYERVELIVETETEGKKVPCMAYKLRDETRNEAVKMFGDKLVPSLRYKNVIIQGAKEHNFPEEYIAFLQAIPDNGYNGDVEAKIPLI